MKKNTQKGFTLVELLVVIAILAILASVAVVGYTSFIEKADQSKADAEIKQAINIINAHYADARVVEVTEADLNDFIEEDEELAKLLGTIEVEVVDGEEVTITYKVGNATATGTLLVKGIVEEEPADPADPADPSNP